MSERLPASEAREQLHQPEHNKDQAEKLKALLERAEKAPDNKDKVPELSELAKEEAITAEDFPKAEKETGQPGQSLYVSRELKQQTYHRTLTRIRKHLPFAQKTLSKVIHQPIVDSVSKVGEKTIARPSGLLGGSIVAFVGSSTFLWAAKHYGFQYNYLLFFLLFVAGFMIGMILELVLFAVRRKRA